MPLQPQQTHGTTSKSPKPSCEADHRLRRYPGSRSSHCLRVRISKLWPVTKRSRASEQQDQRAPRITAPECSYVPLQPTKNQRVDEASPTNGKKLRLLEAVVLMWTRLPSCWNANIQPNSGTNSDVQVNEIIRLSQSRLQRFQCPEGRVRRVLLRKTTNLVP
jgi:hypothetical protein